MLVRTIKSIVMILVLSSLTPAECHDVVASSSKIFESSVTEFHIPASFVIVATSVSPYQMRSSGEHDSVSFKVSFKIPGIFGMKEQVRVRDRVPVDGFVSSLDK